MTSENSNSLSKQETIQQLRKTIGQIETIVEQLNQTSVTELPSSSTIKKLTETTTELEQIIIQKSAIENKLETESQSDPSSVDKSSVSLDIKEEKQTIIIEPKSNTEVIKNIPQVDESKKYELESPKVKQNPISNNQQISKKNRRNILVAVAIFIITIIPLSWEWFIAEKNHTVVSPDIAQTIVEDKNIELEPDTIENNELIEEDYITSIPPITEPTIETNPEIPSELLAENRPKKVSIKTIKASKKLTSDQNLIAAIEDKEIELVKRYTNDLVTSIEPNFESNTVVVTVGNNWYDIEADKQNTITEEILKKSRQLEFDKLKIIDSQNNLVARSPVVGRNIVILRRTI